MKISFIPFKTADGKPHDISNSLFFLGFLGFGVILIYGFADRASYLTKVPECVLLGLATTTVGLFIGFLFGIPKHTAKAASGRYTSNTNLEEISDWLTKILVGLGLAQLTFIPGQFMKLVDYLSLTIVGVPENLISSIIIYFLLYGFFTGYLTTRLYLSKEFAKIEDILQKQLQESVERLVPGAEKNVIVDGTRTLGKDEPTDKSLEKPVSEIILQTKQIEESGGVISADQYYKQGRVMIMNQNYTTAKEYFMKSYGMGGSYNAKSNAAVIASRFLSNYAEADKLFGELIDKDRDNPLGYYNRACNYVRMKDYGAAIADLKTAFEKGDEWFKLEASKDLTFEPLREDQRFTDLLK